MKSLTLLRHAKSDWNDTVARDFDRPLNERGRRAARAIGAYMAAEGLAFDRILASPARRVSDTLEEVGTGLGRVLDAIFDERLYLASPETLTEVIGEAGDEAGRLLLVGHNPGLEELALALAADDAANPMRREVEVKYPTATLAEIELDVERWADATEGRIIRFVRPRDLDPSLGPDS